MRLGLGVVAFSLLWGVTADGDPQRGPANNRRPRSAPPRPGPAPATYDPYNRAPQPAPPPYDPNAYDPYTDPRQPPPTPPPGYDPYNRPQPTPQPYDPYNRRPQPAPQPYDPYNRSPQPAPQPYYPPQGAPPQPQWNSPAPQQPPPQPQWNAPTPSQPPPPVTWNPSPSPSPVPSPTPAPSTSAKGSREWNTALATPPASATLPTPHKALAPGLCMASGMGGSTYGGAPSITVQWPAMPEAYVPLLDVTNGCGPGSPSVDGGYLDESTYLDSNSPELTWGTPRHSVNFRKACLMHDVGYSGAKSYDVYAGVVRDFFDDTRAQIDNRFYTDMVTECESQIPAAARDARANCREYGGYHMSHGARTRYDGVSAAGSAVGAWKDRPNLNGVWRVESGQQRGAWTITQNKRSVTATWEGGAAAPGVTGEFRGTLISYDAWATVEGYYVLYDNGVPRCQPVPASMRWEPGDRTKLTVNAPGQWTLRK